jgi:hypothetical protein
MSKVIDYKKVFSKLSHIKALSHDQKFDQIVQNIITHTLNQTFPNNPKSENEAANRIKEIYGISIRENIIQSNLDKLLQSGEVYRDRSSRQYQLEINCASKIRQRIEDASQLEATVKNKWFEEIKLELKEIEEENYGLLWKCLITYLSNVFEQHGIQTLRLLNPSVKIDSDDQKSLSVIVEQIRKENNDIFTKDILTRSINQFIINADEVRTNYLSQLADATFTSFALTSDAETVSFLNNRYNNLQLFLDTNFIFGILDLHKNSEDGAAREILDEIKKSKLPFILCYHPETLAEFKRAFDTKAMYVRATKWTRETSRVALKIDGLSPLEELFHRKNIDNEIDPAVFLDKYNHVDLILKDLGFIEYIPKRIIDLEHAEIETDVEAYQDFYDLIPNRKFKSFQGFKHDVLVIREVRSLNSKKTKFLESHAFFISSDFILAKFEKKYYKRTWEINYVVSPSVFLQLVRPFIESDYNSNKRFIDTFSIPELRTFEIDYSSTRSKTLQILNDNYHDTSIETKVNILRDQVLLEKLSQLNDDHDKQNQLIENHIALENKVLAENKRKVESDLNSMKLEKEAIELENIFAQKNAAVIQNEKHVLLKMNSDALDTIASKERDIYELKNTFDVMSIEQQIEFKKLLLKQATDSLFTIENLHAPLKRVIQTRIRMNRFYLALIPVIFYSGIFYFINRYGWGRMEQYTYGLSAFVILIGYIFIAIKGDNFNPQIFFKLMEKTITLRVYKEFNFDLSELQKIKLSIDKLNAEISTISKAESFKL